jgi:hypothetical protein
MRQPSDVENDIESWIVDSEKTFKTSFPPKDNKLWVLKYFSARFLEGFLNKKRLVISAGQEYTWGDGLYITPLQHHYSSMIYGRIGIMGWVDPQDVQRVYDASKRKGIQLYQEWIATHYLVQYRLLTTTIHSAHANRILRNNFRRLFKIDLVFFRPDQYNRAYIAPRRDRWFALSDWAGVHAHSTGQTPSFSDKVQKCEWIALIEEEFERSDLLFKDLIGPHSGQPIIFRSVFNRQDLTSQYEQTYQQNLVRGSNPPNILRVRL